MNGKKRIILAFCACILLLVAVGGYSYFNTRKYLEAAEWVAHSRAVMNEVKNIYAAAQDVETSQRGYVISGEERYLGPFDNAVKSSRNALYRARYSIRDNPEQLAILDKIDDLMKQKIAFATEVVKLRKSAGFDAARKMVTTFRGEGLMNDMRTQLSRFTENEESLLNDRLSVAQQRFQQVISIIILLVVLSIATILVTLYLFIKDYNKRLRSEELVRESEIRFKRMLEAIPIGVFVVTSDGKLYYSNHQLTAILGSDIPSTGSFEKIRTDLKFCYAGTDEVITGDDSPIMKALRGEPAYGFDNIELIRNDGTRICLRLNTIPLFNSHGTIEYVISLFEDVTNAAQSEKELREAKRMAEESLLLKETFLANMSHEIRTPMNAILGFTDLLLKEAISEKERDYVSTIRTSGENLLRIINDILDLSKIEANMMEFEQHPLNIQDIFRSLNTMLSHKAKEKKLDLSFKCDPRLSGTLIGDPTRLTQIIINLVGNAIKFTKKGSVTVEAFLLDYDSDGYEVNFAITDTGIGIPPDKLHAIFERFRQAETYTTRSYGGTGLGLSIARQLVELQGGTMEITSEIDGGSCFSFRLRFSKPTEAMLRQETKRRQTISFEQIRNMRILLAEDNPINVKLIRNLFDTHEVTIEVAENGQEVVDLLKQEQYDLILMDLEMPVMNGYETTKIIRGDMGLSVPIIAMTAHAMAGEQEKCLQLGMNDFISKPINIETLFEKMDLIAQTTRPKGQARPTAGPAETIGTPLNAASGHPDGRIDLSYLQELSSGNRSFEKEMLSLFMQQIPLELEEMREAYDKGDLAVLKNLAHKMKSSVPLVGANYLVPLLNRLEDTDGNRTPDYDQAFLSFAGQLEACFETVTEELAAYG